MIRNIKITHLLPASPVIRSSGKREYIQDLIKVLESSLIGASSSSIVVDEDDGVAASGTLTCTSVIATDACSVAGVTFTAVANGATPTDVQFKIGTSDATCAANLAAAITAKLPNVVVATSALGVVTVTAAVKGLIGNQIPLTTSDSTIVVSGALLTGGTENTKTTYSF